MAKLFQESSDGASAQACAVRAYLAENSGIEGSWCDEWKRYKAEPEIDRWYNCREQGYVVSMRSADHKRQINIAFFEHRNSDEICAIEWEQNTLNPPTISTAKFNGVYKDKWDVSHSVQHGEAFQMADWIFSRLNSFWAKSDDSR